MQTFKIDMVIIVRKHYRISAHKILNLYVIVYGE